MKLTRTLSLVVAGAGWFAAVGSHAQETNAPATGMITNRPPAMRGAPMDIAKFLNLTDDQKPKVTAILNTQRDKINAAYQETTLSIDDRRAKIKAIRDQATAQLKDILTPEQFQKWQSIQVRVRRITPSMPPPGPGMNSAGTNTPPPNP